VSSREPRRIPVERVSVGLDWAYYGGRYRVYLVLRYPGGEAIAVELPLMEGEA